MAIAFPSTPRWATTAAARPAKPRWSARAWTPRASSPETQRRSASPYRDLGADSFGRRYRARAIRRAVQAVEPQGDRATLAPAA